MWPCVPRLHLRKFGATTCSRMTLDRTTFCIATPRKMIVGKTKLSPLKEKLTHSRITYNQMTFSRMTHNQMTFGRMTLSKMLHIRRISIRMILIRIIPKEYIAE
jgi:hypothetical protein